MFDKAIASFQSQIEKLSEKEIESRLNKYNPVNYGGLTFNQLSTFSISSKSYHTKLTHADWFSINSPYFSDVSDFFNNVLDNPIPTEEFWYKDPPNDELIISNDLINPQDTFVGFLFKFVL